MAGRARAPVRPPGAPVAAVVDPVEAVAEPVVEPVAEPAAVPAQPDDAAPPADVPPEVAEVAEVAEPAAVEPAPPAAEPAPEPVPPPPPPDWRIDYGASFIEFTAEQAGAPFTGRWTDWSADMRFEPDALADSGFDVVIRVAGVETQDDDRDATLQDAEFFHGSQFPEARFETGAIRSDGAGYASESTLTIKGTGHAVTFRFEVEENGTSRVLTGTARLDRLALGVGTGEWTDTEWVGQYVDVNVRVEADVAAD